MVPETKNNRKPTKQEEKQVIEDELKVTTSVNIYLRQKKWMEERDLNISDFIRKAVEDKITEMSGYELEIERTRERIKNMSRKIEEEKENLTQLEQKQEQYEEEVNMKNKNDLIVRAITNIDYSGWKEAAEDLEELKGALTTEAWERMVRERWEEIHGT